MERYRNLEQFLTDMALEPPNTAMGDTFTAETPAEDRLVLSTIHSAKGQEWKSVFVLNAVDGCIPSDLGTGSSAELEEERRLLYVAMTRARDRLTLGIPLRFYVTQQTRNGDRHLYAIRTRFIPKEILNNFEAVYWSPALKSEGAVSPAPAPIDVGARMRSMWG